MIIVVYSNGSNFYYIGIEFVAASFIGSREDVQNVEFALTKLRIPTLRSLQSLSIQCYTEESGGNNRFLQDMWFFSLI